MPFWPTYGNNDRASTGSQLSPEEAIFPTWWESLAPYCAEFIGTFLLTLTFLCNYSGTAEKTLWAVSANALMVIAMVYAFGHVSGANFNPSVCISLWLSGRYKATVAARFCLVQVLGAICAGVVRSQFGGSVNIGPKSGYGWGHVMLVEALYTGLICLVYLNCAASMKNNPPGDWNGFVGVAVGFSFIAGGYASSQVCNSVFNSAIAVGMAIVDKKEGALSWNGVGYFLYDLLGAVIGASFYRILRPAESSRSFNLGERDPATIPSTLSAGVAAELIGTYYVVITKALNRLGHSDTVGAEAWSVAAVIVALVYSFKDISGAYFNPAVTASVAASRRNLLTTRATVIYICVQVLGGLLASSTYAMVHGAGIQINFGSKYSTGAVIVSEMLFSLLTSYTVLSTGVAVDGLLGGPAGFAAEPALVARGSVKGPRTRCNNLVGLTYAGCHIVSGYSIGKVSGSILNPAIALGFSGLEVLHGDLTDAGVVQYMLYQVAGALLASGLFFITHAHLYRDEAVASDDLKA